MTVQTIEMSHGFGDILNPLEDDSTRPIDQEDSMSSSDRP